MKGGKQKIGKPGAGSLETFLTTDGIRMGTGWDQDIGLLHLIQIVSVPSVVKLVWIDRTKTGEEKMKSGKKKIGKLRSGSAKGFLTTKGAK